MARSWGVLKEAFEDIVFSQLIADKVDQELYSTHQYSYNAAVRDKLDRAQIACNTQTRVL